MIADLDVCLAVRARIRSLVVLSVTDSIEATATGYARASGSFLDDGFEIGMEVTGSGFTNSANDEAKVITDVAALSLTTAGLAVDPATGFSRLSGGPGTVVEGTGTRTLSVGMPSAAEYPNERIVPDESVPWWREEYAPGPASRRTLEQSNAFVEQLVDYFVTLFLPAGTGPNAAQRYMTALRERVPAGQVISLTDPDTSCRVRGDPAPFFRQPFQSIAPNPGFYVVPFTVPLELWTINS